MRKINLTARENAIENSLLKGEYTDVAKDEFEEIATSITARKKDAVLNIRVNSNDIAQIKEKAKRLGVKYQTLIAELIHRVAQT